MISASPLLHERSSKGTVETEEPQDVHLDSIAFRTSLIPQWPSDGRLIWMESSYMCEWKVIAILVPLTLAKHSF
jgi:hypothetical protein